MKISALVLLSLLLAVMAAGCSTAKPPKEAIVSAMTKMQEVKSMTFKGSFALDDIALPQSAANDSSQAAMAAGIVNMLKGATFNVHGSVQTDPERAELTVDVKLGSDGMNINLSVPMIVTQDKIWIKVPQIPMLAIPDSIAGKFVEIDTKKLMEEQGFSTPDVKNTQKLVQDVMKTVLDNFDEKTYFSEPKQADVKDLPEGFKADRFVRFAVTQQNADQAMTAMIGKIAPSVIDLLLQNESYVKTLQLKKEDLEKAKKELEGQQDDDVKKTIDEVKKNLKINEFSITGGITDGYMTFEDVRMNVDLADAGDTTKVAAHMMMTFDDLNKDVKFEYELPKDAIPVEKLQELLGAGTAGGGMQ